MQVHILAVEHVVKLWFGRMSGWCHMYDTRLSLPQKWICWFLGFWHLEYQAACSVGQIYCEISVDAFFSDFQRIRDLEDKTDIQKRQIKDLEEKVGSVTLLKHTDELCFESSAPVLLNYMTFLICSVICTCWWWSTLLSFQFVSVDRDFNLKILHDIIKYVMGIWYVCVCTYL